MIEKKHIFLVEDELHLRLTLSLILRKAGFRVTAAEDGSKALKLLQELKIRSEKVDMLVTDIQVPGLTGIQIIDGIKKMDLEIPCLVITGYGSKDTVIELMRKGCSEYLDKPFEPEEFLKRVNIVLEKEEHRKAERDKQVKEFEDEKSEIKREVEAYKQNFEKLREQVDLAVGAYKNLVDIDEESLKIPISYHYKPFSELGGDFVDIRNSESGCDILVADVAGHDMGASYHAVLVKVLFDENCRLGCNGKSFFKHLNTQLIEHGKHKRMVTALFLRLDLRTMQGEIVTAGHPPLICVYPDNPEPELFDTKGNVLGIFSDAAFGYRQFEIVPGQRFFLYTDGITNACRVDGPTGKKQKLRGNGLDNLLQGYRSLSLKEVLHHVWQDVISFCRYKPTDDMLLLGVEIPGA
jgi:serine phosphatase RsbU (regulator of sigma subunit)